jgi:hypothetical protein
MLVELLNILQHTQGGLSLAELSRRLGVDTGVISGMLQLLVSKGRIVEMGPAGSACTACPLHSDCNMLSGQNSRYVLVSRGAGRPGAKETELAGGACCR